jgi:hypothetical protein
LSASTADTRTTDLGTEMSYVTNEQVGTGNMNILDKGVIPTLGTMSRDLILLLRTALNLKLMNYFWDFPFNTFGSCMTR